MARPDDKRDLQGAAALVTGAGSGVGAAVAEALAGLGARVALVGRDAAKLRRTAAGLNTATEVCAGDVGDADFCEHALELTAAQFGGIDVLVNNAGIIHRAGARDTADAHWAQTLRVNLDGVFRMSRGAAARMTRQGRGAIVNVASTVALVGAGALAAYCASKGGVVQLTRAMALECAAEGVTVNAVCPGAIESPMLFSAHPPGVSEEQVRARNLAQIPQGRLATPAEVARAVIFLATEPHITGVALPVDGGYTAQ